MSPLLHEAPCNMSPFSCSRRQETYSGSILSRATGRESTGPTSPRLSELEAARGSEEGGAAGGSVGGVLSGGTTGTGGPLPSDPRGRGWLSFGEGGATASGSLTSLRAAMLAKAQQGAMARVGPRTYRTFIVQEYCQRGEDAGG